MDNHGFIRSFQENAGGGPGLVNAGTYLLEDRLLEAMPERPFSLERDIFPALLDQGAAGFATEAQVLDIGTTDRLNLARNTL